VDIIGNYRPENLLEIGSVYERFLNKIGRLFEEKIKKVNYT